MQTDINEFIMACESMTIATEDYSDISVFLEDPIRYLDYSSRNEKFSDPDALYCKALDTNGIIYNSVTKACNDLVRVNAYSEAMAIYSKMIEVYESLLDQIPKDEKGNVEWAIGEMKNALMNTMKQRDEYTSKRKATIARYSYLAKFGGK